MITFEEAIKELNITLPILQKSQPHGDVMIVHPECYYSSTFVNFVLRNRDCEVTFKLKERSSLDMAIVFRDDSVRKYFPLMTAVEIDVIADTVSTLKALYSASPTPSCHEQELNKRLTKLCTILCKNITTPKQYTEFGQGARAAFEAIICCNDDQESEGYMQEIKSKSFKEIHKEINTEIFCCPLCGSEDTSQKDSDWGTHTYYQDFECNKCGCTFSQAFEFTRKESIKDDNGTIIIPTNQEVKE